MPHRTTALLVAAPLVLVALRAHAEPLTKPLRDDDIVARVNGTVIYRKAVREVVQGMLSLEETQPDAATVGRYADDALDSLIDLELLYQESQARGVTVTDAAVDEEIARTKSRFPDARSFAAVMKAKGMTDTDLRRDTRKTMAVNRLLEGGIWKDITISPEQIKDFYEQNREEFKHPPEIRASHILLRAPEDAPAAERKAAKDRAAALLAQLKGGADFATLARQHSQDPVTAVRGGDLGFFAKGDMVEAFENQAFALTPGALSDVVSTPFGFHIIKVTDRRAAGYLPLDEVDERIRAVLTKTEKQKRQADLVAALRKQAKIAMGKRGK